MTSLHNHALTVILGGFVDPDGIEEVFNLMCPGLAMNDPDIVGMGNHADALIIGYAEGFVKELRDPESKFYAANGLLRQVDRYLDYFDVTANGPDLLKYICAFGAEFERYLTEAGERELVKMLVRFSTVRLLRIVAAANRPDGTPPPEMMVKKIYKVRKLNADEVKLGRYGMYMTFKTWALG